jgi:nitroimidazol reductase NimA-like FMN-containing flavoprotein (pyridoxamine 5'-phosphate oxidase superfamily)
MRRAEKEITDVKEIAAVMEKADVCRIALIDGDYPYIIPVNFVVHGNFLYLHSSPEGRKIELLKKNNRVCFEMDIDVEIVRRDTPCFCSTRYLSVIGFGRSRFLDTDHEKSAALNFLTQKYIGGFFSYDAEALGKLTVIEIEIEKLTGKKSGYR